MKDINNYIQEKLFIGKDYQFIIKKDKKIPQSQRLFDCVKKILDSKNIKYDDIKLNAKKRTVVMFDTYRYQEIRKLAEEILPEIIKDMNLQKAQTIEYDCGYSDPNKTRLAFRFTNEEY